MTLQLKHRPQNLKRFICDKQTKTNIESMLNREVDDMPHSWLIYGPSGTGKTTLARIMANMLDCYSYEEESYDYIELNTADFRGIDMVRDLRANMYLAPVQSDFRIWLIDECHQLSNDAQEAMLKILEESPLHCVFILATTNPEKLKVTLKRRCSQIELKAFTEERILSHLQKIVSRERKTIPDDILDKISSQCEGSPGIALAMLDSIIDMDDDQMESHIKRIDNIERQAIDLCRSLHKGTNWKTISSLLKELKSENPENIRRVVLGYMQSILLNKQDDRAFLIMEEFEDNTYDIGFPGIVLNCYRIINS